VSFFFLNFSTEKNGQFLSRQIEGLDTIHSLSSGEAIFLSAFGGESRLVFVCIYKHATYVVVLQRVGCCIHVVSLLFIIVSTVVDLSESAVKGA